MSLGIPGFPEWSPANRLGEMKYIYSVAYMIITDSNSCAK